MNDYSQTSEGTILWKLCQRLGIKTGWTVEFGAGVGPNLSNTWGFLELGWNCVLIEANPGGFALLKKAAEPYSTAHLINARVTCEPGERLDDHLRTTKIPEDFDILSIDIDSNDYWVWESLQWYRPKIVVIEHNMSPRFVGLKSVAYDPNLTFQTTDYFGASSEALIYLGEQKGYKLVDATIHNLVFVLKHYPILAFDPGKVPKVTTYKFDTREPISIEWPNEKQPPDSC